LQSSINPELSIKLTQKNSLENGVIEVDIRNLCDPEFKTVTVVLPPMD
jgi:hypothetical protein